MCALRGRISKIKLWVKMNGIRHLREIQTHQRPRNRRLKNQCAPTGITPIFRAKRTASEAGRVTTSSSGLGHWSRPFHPAITPRPVKRPGDRKEHSKHLSTEIYTQLSIAASSTISVGLILFCNSAVRVWLVDRAQRDPCQLSSDRSIALVRGPVGSLRLTSELIVSEI